MKLFGYVTFVSDLHEFSNSSGTKTQVREVEITSFESRFAQDGSLHAQPVRIGMRMLNNTAASCTLTVGLLMCGDATFNTRTVTSNRDNQPHLFSDLTLNSYCVITQQDLDNMLTLHV